MFTAHLKQAQTLQRRVQTCELMWSQLEALATDRQIPERAIPALFDAVAGYRVRRTTSVAALEESGERISVQTAR